MKQYKAFKETEAFETLKNSNAEVTLMALPLTFAMTINVFFVLGALFVPNLWSVIEFMFPFALIGSLWLRWPAKMLCNLLKMKPL